MIAARFRQGRLGGEESGFTLIELLIVTVIVPLLIGAVAAVVIVTVDNQGTTRTRINDSSNAQVTAAYFARDVQGAQFVTTNASATSPAVCGNGSQFLLGLSRPAASNPTTVSAFNVSYWLTGTGASTQILRLACTGSTVASTVVISDDVNPQIQGTATITPAVFASSATAGWTPTLASTTTTTMVDLSKSNTTIPVTSTAGFSTADPINVLSSAGVQSETCTGMSSTSFTGCKAGTGITTSAAPVTQPVSIEGVKITVTEPGTGYTYSLVGTPRSSSTLQYGAQSAGGGGGPPLLINDNSSSPGNGISWNGNASIIVNGQVALNYASFSCNGNAGSVSATGYEAIQGSSALGKCASGPTTTLTQPILDPLAPYLPGFVGSGSTPKPAYPTPGPTAPYFPKFTGASVYATPQGPTCNPGEYGLVTSGKKTSSAFAGCTTLTPGVYVLDEGFTQSLSYSGPSGSGVLLYLPCNAPADPTQCGESVNMGGGTSVDLPPLSATQSTQLFGTPALGGVVLWQDANNTAAATLQGNPGVSTPGTFYFPSAPLTLGGTSALLASHIIAESLSIGGGGHGGSCLGSSADICVTG